MLDDDFQYLGEEEDNFDNDQDDQTDVEPRIKNGKKVHGNDRDWKQKRKFQHPETF